MFASALPAATSTAPPRERQGDGDGHGAGGRVPYGVVERERSHFAAVRMTIAVTS